MKITRNRVIPTKKQGPDKLMFCPCSMTFLEHTGKVGEARCPNCSKMMTCVAEFPENTWSSGAKSAKGSSKR
jgi:hypothetical protein